MKKIAVVTLYDDYNFGNKIQNYAVQTYFRTMGADVTTVVDARGAKPGKIRLGPVGRAKKIAHFILQHIGLEKDRVREKERLGIRREYIKTFSDEYLTTTPPVDYRHLPRDLAKQFDYFAAGSDQVWHGWKNDRRELEYYFLMFADPAQRLTIAPSFGFDEFPQEYLSIYKKGLEGFEYLSVREEQGARLVKELTGREATVLLDPTMLIDTAEWRKLLRRPSQYADENYIFVYALGEFQGEVAEKTRKLAGELGLQVIDVMDKNSDYYIHTRPDEFLYWISRARLVVTDSFHAAIFSILFDRPFVVTGRSDIPGMGSRLDTLFKKFGIAGRHFAELRAGFESEGEVRDRLFAAGYPGVPAVLEAERKKAAAFYKMCFHED